MNRNYDSDITQVMENIFIGSFFILQPIFLTEFVELSRTQRIPNGTLYLQSAFDKIIKEKKSNP